jgi:hypothetical protein
MRHFTRYIFVLILLLLFASIFFYKPPKTQAPVKNVLSQTVTATVSAIITTSNSKCHARYIDSNDTQAVLPDQNCTPGVINPSVTQNNLFDTICKSGFTKSIRPSSSYTNKLKKQQIIEYGYFDNNLKNYEEDHLISLELGGDPSSPLNLWPEPHGSPNEKDRVENYLNDQICSGKMRLDEAQRIISGNWYEIYLQIKNNSY